MACAPQDSDRRWKISRTAYLIGVLSGLLVACTGAAEGEGDTARSGEAGLGHEGARGLREADYGCGADPGSCPTACGDGLIAGAETCDDGNATSGDGCDADCHIETGYSCDGIPSACTRGCGD